MPSSSSTPRGEIPGGSENGADALLGSVIDGRYRLDERLGIGGMGVVYRAHHLALERDVAVKFIRPDLAFEPVVAERFLREARSASRLDHPHCVRVNDFGETAGGHRYLVMELLRGRELRELVGAPWRPSRAVDLMLQIFEALAHAHGLGVVHRDLKPANVLITNDHRGEPMAKIVDFGLARMVDLPAPAPGGPARPAGSGVETSAGYGTPRYMSPEQAAGRPVDARSDLYAAGVIFYELLTGRPPFDAEEGSEVARMHIEQAPPPLPDTVPTSLRRVVERLLAKGLEERCGSAREALEALRVIYAEVSSTPAGAAVTERGKNTDTLPVEDRDPTDRQVRRSAPGGPAAFAAEGSGAEAEASDEAGASMVGSRTLPPGLVAVGSGARPGTPPSITWARGAPTLLGVKTPVVDGAEGSRALERPGTPLTFRRRLPVVLGLAVVLCVVALAVLVTVAQRRGWLETPDAAAPP